MFSWSQGFLKFMNLESKNLNEQSTHAEQIDLTQLKSSIKQQVPTNWPFRQVLLEESDVLDVSVFLNRLPLYLKLIEMGGK